MSEDVKIPRAVLAALCAVLLVSLVAVGFLLGRQSPSTPPTPQTSAESSVESAAAPPPLAVEQPADQSLDARLDALDKRIAARQKQVGGQRLTPAPPPSPSVPPSSSPTQGASADSTETVRAYFAAIDAIVGGSAAIADPQPMAARLLQQALGGDENHFDTLVERTSKAKSDLASVKAPASCREHHELLLSQLTSAEVLIREVRTAKESGDTAKLSSLAASSDTVEDEARRLQELDRSLRAKL